MKIVISSGHGKKIRGASGYIDEVDEARKVVNRVVEILGPEVATPYHDDVSTTQNENLNRIVDFHNSKTRDLDVSVHFNAYGTTSKPMGTECLYVSQDDLAAEVAAAMAAAGGFINRGPKKRTDLFFLNNTESPAILIEVCFVDSAADVDLYHENFEKICVAIADTLDPIGAPVSEVPMKGIIRGKVSWFGGPEDTGVSPGEGLAFIYELDDKPWIFLEEQPPGTTGLARRLDPETHFIAMRWDYNQHSKDYLAGPVFAIVRNPKNGKRLLATPADWGPHEDTGRVADISKGLMDALGLQTDDEVEVVFPL
jgi:hypothetical protein